MYSLIADGEEQASSPLEQIARAQIAAGAPSIVRFQLTPTPSFFEELARRLYRRHENKLVRQERWGLPEGGLWSTFNRAEMRAAERTQNRSLFWLETVIAADSREVCKTVAAAVQSRRGENRLHRRWMIIRQRPLPPPVPTRARTAGPIVPDAGVGRRGRAPARAPVRADEGRPRPPGHDPADPRPTRSHPRPPHPPRRADRRGAPRRAVGNGRARVHAATTGSFSEGGSTVTTYDPGPEDLYPMLRADNAEVAHPSLGPQVRGAAGRWPGHGQELGPALLLPERPRGSRCGADRDRPQVRALAHLPAT